MKYNNLIISLRSPTKIFLGSNMMGHNLLIDSVAVCSNFPPWPSGADILYNSESRIFVGVTYQVPEDHRQLIKALCARLNDEVVRYNDFSAKESLKPYAHEHEDIHFLEIVWTPWHNADEFALAQFCEDSWYYLDRGIARKFAFALDKPELDKIPPIIAFGLDDLDEILDEYKLVLPDEFPFPTLDVRTRR